MSEAKEKIAIIFCKSVDQAKHCSENRINLNDQFEPISDCIFIILSLSETLSKNEFCRYTIYIGIEHKNIQRYCCKCSLQHQDVFERLKFIILYLMQLRCQKVASDILVCRRIVATRSKECLQAQIVYSWQYIWEQLNHHFILGYMLYFRNFCVYAVYGTRSCKFWYICILFKCPLFLLNSRIWIPWWYVLGSENARQRYTMGYNEFASVCSMCVRTCSVSNAFLNLYIFTTT